MDSQIALQQPVLDGGIRSINFFNGRLLSARDLTREQSAYREADRRLGQAVGEGIAYGLEVSKSLNSTEAAPVVTVESGLAVNRTGQTLMLSAKTEIALVRRADASATVQTFGECLPLQTGTYVAGAGVYLLTLAPAQSTEGRAVTSGLNSATASCNTDTMVTAVQFRLIQLDPPITAGEMLDENHLRNLIAYKCFGLAETSSFTSDPFGPPLKSYGLLDELRSNRLTDCDVPLGVLYWTLTGGIRFIDMWSVRRRPTRLYSSAGKWATTFDDRRGRESEALFLQFQDHIDSLRKGPAPVQVKATEHFHYLPPVGVIPLAGIKGSSGLDLLRFFEGLPYRNPIYIEGAKFPHVLRSFSSYAPIDLKSGEMLWLYLVRENMEPIDKGKTLTPRPYLLFTSGHVPYLGNARFDVGHWDYGNFALDIA